VTLTIDAGLMRRDVGDVALVQAVTLMAWRENRSDPRLTGVLAAIDWLAGDAGVSPVTMRPTPQSAADVRAEVEQLSASAVRARRLGRSAPTRDRYVLGMVQVLEYALGVDNELVVDPSAIAA
jgi:hypothetical protein